ncbi:MAG: hypothetical protein C0484_18155 [Rhodospirillum sp.]|nr:hypothetical protein [Rhodospirillum sp.]
MISGGGVVRLSVPGRFLRDWLHDRYGHAILECFRPENLAASASRSSCEAPA